MIGDGRALSNEADFERSGEMDRSSLWRRSRICGIFLAYSLPVIQAGGQEPESFYRAHEIKLEQGEKHIRSAKRAANLEAIKRLVEKRNDSLANARDRWHGIQRAVVLQNIAAAFDATTIENLKQRGVDIVGARLGVIVQF